MDVRKLKRVILKHVTPIGNEMYPYRKFNDRFRCIFVHIPKNAGTSVLSALNLGREPLSQLHATAEEYRRADPARFEKYIKFAVVRDPYDRFLSAYKYLKGGGDGRNDSYLLERNHRYFDSLDSFAEFLSADSAMGVTVLRPQWTFIYDFSKDEMLCDEIFRYERFADLEGFMRERFTDKPLPKSNVSSVGGDRSIPVLSKYAKEKVRLIYDLDFEIFGYPR